MQKCKKDLGAFANLTLTLTLTLTCESRLTLPNP